MKPINQTDNSRHKGNCMQACLASLFELAMTDTINIIDYGENWAIQLDDWIESKGYSWENNLFSKDDLKSYGGVNGYALASVKSRNYTDGFHAVIINLNGDVVHDPSETKKWQGVNVYDYPEEFNYWDEIVQVSKKY